jgi:DNA-binding IclR family transcriptional regulator
MQRSDHRLLQNALEILNFVADSSEPVVFRNLQQAFPLPKSTISKLLLTMINSGYLERDSLGVYTIGVRCFKTGNSFRISNPFLHRAKDIVEGVCKACNETTHLAVLDGTDVVYIYKFDSAHPIRIYSAIGKRIPAHTTAIGKALLSGYTDEEIYALYPDAKLPIMTPNSITSIKELINQLHEIRKTSVAYESEESTPHVKCIAVPINNSENIPIAGLSLAVPIYRGSKNTKTIINTLLEAKKKLEELHAIYE